MTTRRPQFNLIEALCASRGVICVVGAGGKKSTVYRLAMEHSGRVGVTATVAIPSFPETLQTAQVVADEDHIASAVIEASRGERRVAFASPSVKRERLGGVSCSRIMHIHAAAHFDITLVKADGARGRLIKAPRTDEPVIPDGAATVIPVVSARAIGKPISERIVHRVTHLTAVTGAYPGDLITPLHVARLLASADGALKNAGDAAVVPVINMVDDKQLEAAAREAAELALALCDRFQRVAITSMRRANPIIDIISR